MTEDRGIRERIASLRSDPQTVDLAEFFEALEAGEPSTRRDALQGLQIVAGREPDRVLDDVSRLSRYLDDPDWGVRNGTVQVFVRLAKADGSAIADVVPALADRLDDEYDIVGQTALEALRYVTRDDPEAVKPFVADVFPFLESDYMEVSRDAVFCVAGVSLEDATAVAPASDALFARFEEGTNPDPMPRDVTAGLKPGNRMKSMEKDALSHHRNVRTIAGHAIYEIAKADPDLILTRIDTVIDLLDDPDAQVRGAAIDILFVIAGARPRDIEPFVETIAAKLVDDSTLVDGTAAQTLAVLAVEYPGAVVDAVRGTEDALGALLERDEAPVRGAAATLFAVLGDEDPSVVEPVTEQLDKLRETDDAEFVREAASDALDPVA